MKKKKAGRAFLWCGIALVLLAVGFVWYALNHPERGTPFGLPLAGARILYGLYLLGTAAMFVLWVILRKKGQMH